VSKLKLVDRIWVLECRTCGLQYSRADENGECGDCGGELSWVMEQQFKRHQMPWMVLGDGDNK